MIRSAADLSQLVTVGAAQGSNARIVGAIARGGVFLDAHDLGARAFGLQHEAAPGSCRLSFSLNAWQS